MDLEIPKKILRYRKAERCSDFYSAGSSGTRKGWDCGERGLLATIYRIQDQNASSRDPRKLAFH
jgi:hypothetical protein